MPNANLPRECAEDEEYTQGARPKDETGMPFRSQMGFQKCVPVMGKNNMGIVGDIPRAAPPTRIFFFSLLLRS